MEPVKWTIKHSLILIIIVVTILSVQNSMSNNGPEDYFPGYSSQIIRVDPINLSLVNQNALFGGLKVHVFDQWDGVTGFDDPSFLGAGRFWLEPSLDTNFTLYYFEYGSNESGVLN